MKEVPSNKNKTNLNIIMMYEYLKVYAAAKKTICPPYMNKKNEYDPLVWDSRTTSCPITSPHLP